MPGGRRLCLAVFEVNMLPNVLWASLSVASKACLGDCLSHDIRILIRSAVGWSLAPTGEDRSGHSLF